MGGQSVDPLPLRELVINSPIIARHLVDIVQGLATPSLRTFVCFGLFLFRYPDDEGREDEMIALVKKSFPNVSDDRLGFVNMSKKQQAVRPQEEAAQGVVV
jgi:hypothetical protein